MIATVATLAHGSPHGSLYAADMARRELMGIEVARRSLGALVENVKDVQPVMTKHGKPAAAIVGIDWFREACKAMGEPTDI